MPPLVLIRLAWVQWPSTLTCWSLNIVFALKGLGILTIQDPRSSFAGVLQDPLLLFPEAQNPCGKHSCPRGVAAKPLGLIPNLSGKPGCSGRETLGFRVLAFLLGCKSLLLYWGWLFGVNVRLRARIVSGSSVVGFGVSSTRLVVM